jgi:hypothetical protein
MPYKGSKKLTEQKFNTVAAQLASNPYTPDMVKVIAAANGLQPSTVALINQYKTWERWMTRKAKEAAYTAQRRTAKTPAKKSISIEDGFDKQFQEILKKEVHEIRGDLRNALGRIKNLEDSAKEAKRLKRWWGRK